MRLVPSTRHALAAVALAALAAGSASAADFYLKIKDRHGVTSTTGLQSFSWGTSRPTGGAGGGIYARTVNLNSSKSNREIAVSDPGADGPKNPRPNAASDASAGGRADIAAGAAAGGAAGGGVIAPRDSASGLATGKRQHLPIRITNPLNRGSVTVNGSMPGCAVGATYPEATLEGAGMRYELKDIQITSCATGQLSLNYAKVRVRGWDPAKKQE